MDKDDRDKDPNDPGIKEPQIKFTLEDLKRLDVELGDTILIRLPTDFYTKHNAEQLTARFRGLFPEVRVVIMPKEADVIVLRDKVKGDQSDQDDLQQ